MTNVTTTYAVLFRDPQTGRPFPWEYHRKGRLVEIPVRGFQTTTPLGAARRRNRKEVILQT
jgi:hypothetical protein